MIKCCSSPGDVIFNDIGKVCDCPKSFLQINCLHCVTARDLKTIHGPLIETNHPLSAKKGAADGNASATPRKMRLVDVVSELGL